MKSDNEVYERWKAFGFLAGLDDEDAHALAERFEELAEFLLTSDYGNDEHVAVLAFPVLRRSFTKGLNDKYSPGALCEKIKKDYNQIEKIKAKSMTNIDAEAEFAGILSDYFSRDKNGKK